MSFFKRLLSKNRTLFLSILLVLSLVFARPVYADALSITWALGSSAANFAKSLIGGELNAENLTTKLIADVMQTFNIILGGCNEKDCPPELANGGVNAMLADASIKTTINPPASSKEYLADVGQSIGLIPKPVYAQGVGYEGFRGILEIWKAFRNLAYLFLVLVFVIIGFMIMFRKKLNPQTVITIQQAIPKLIVTMLLITFSYAIAGLILDLSQVAIRLVGATFKATGFVAIRDGSLEAIFDKNIFELMNPLRQTGQLVNALSSTTMNKLAGASMWIFAIFLNCILFFATFYIMIKTFISLIGPYVQIALSIVFAPFQLLLGAIPGNNNALSKWVKGLLANAMVFPVVLSMLFLAAIFKSGDGPCFGKPLYYVQGEARCGSSNIWGATDWSTRMERINVNFPAAGIGNWGGAIGELIGLGILFMIPKAVEMTKAFIMGKEFPGGEAAMGEIYKNLGKVPMLGKILGS